MATISAMGMHLQGDDAHALALLKATLTAESHYIALAKQSDALKQLELLRSTQSKTEALRVRLSG